MAVTEPRSTAVVLLLLGALLVTSALLSRVSARSGVPLVLGFVGLGLLLGEEGIGHIGFRSYTQSFRLGTTALVLILYDAGLHTPKTTFRRYLAPATVLATLGVAVTAGLVAVAAHLFGFSWSIAFLLGAIVSSTDAAAVFSVLRAGGVELHERVGATLEVESGLNDPMAVILTLGITESLASGQPMQLTSLLFVLRELVVGSVVGWAIGALAGASLKHLQLAVTGLYPVLSIGIAFVTFGIASFAHGSGFLAVYLAGILLGNAKLPYKAALERVHDFVAWIGQVGMFVVLGLLARPSNVVAVAAPGIGLAAFGALVARPLAVAVCLLPFRYRMKEIAFVSWVGLKGAVPIVLACIPVMAHVPAAFEVFDVVFFVVVFGAALQGSTVRALTKKLKLGRGLPRARRAALEITAARPLSHELVVFEIGEASAVCGVEVADVPFPPDAAAMLLVRGDDLLAPRGSTVLQPGDVVHVFCRQEDRPMLELLFGPAGDA